TQRVRHTEREELLVVVDVALPARLEGARSQHVVGVADDRDAGGREQQAHDVRPGHVREGEARKVGRNAADDGDAVAVEIEDGDDSGTAEDRDQWPWQQLANTPADEEGGEDAGGEDDGADIDLPEVTDDVADLSDRVVGRDRQPGDLAELADDHQYRDS